MDLITYIVPILGGDWLQAIANAFFSGNLTGAGLFISMLLTVVLIVIALASKTGLLSVAIVSLVAMVLFTGIGWLDTMFGAMLAFVFAILAAVTASNQAKTGGQ